MGSEPRACLGVAQVPGWTRSGARAGQAELCPGLEQGQVRVVGGLQVLQSAPQCLCPGLIAATAVAVRSIFRKTTEFRHLFIALLHAGCGSMGLFLARAVFRELVQS